MLLPHARPLNRNLLAVNDHRARGGSPAVSSQNKCESWLLRANWARTIAHYLRMKDGDLFAESPDFVGLRNVYRGWVSYGTIHASSGLEFPKAQIHLSCNRSSTSQRIAKWGVFIALCDAPR